MSSVTPPPPPIPIDTGLPQIPVATINNPPSALLQTALAGRFDALLLQLVKPGEARIQTTAGNAVLNTNLALPKSANLQLQLISTQGSVLKLAVTAINGKKPPGLDKLLTAGKGQSPQNPAGKQNIQGQPATTPTTSSASVKITPTQGAVINAVFGKGLPAPGTPSLQAAKNQFTAVQTPVTGTPAKPGTNPTAPSQPALPRTIASAVKVQPGSQVSVKIVSLQPPVPGKAAVVPTAGTPALNVGQTLNAVVSGQTQNGTPVLTTGVGTVTLPAVSALPPGTTLVLEIQSPLQSPAPSSISAKFQTPIINADWPALNTAFETLDALSPGAANQVVNAIPKPGAQFSSKLLFFISALKSGDLSGWLGDAPVRMLTQPRPGAGSVLDKIKDDFSRLAQTRKDPTGGEWREWTVPVVNNHEIDPVRFYTRPDNEQDDDENDKKKTRFIVDLSLSNLGRLQLDGLVNKDSKRFDLIIKSDDKLSQRMMTDLQTLFNEANELTGAKGGLSFQAKPANFTDFTDDAANKFFV